MADENDIQQIVQDQLDILPDDVRTIVESQDWRKIVYDLGRKYSLKIDQLGALEQEVYYIMIGLVPAGEFLSDLVNRTGVARDVAGSLAKEIDTEIFEKIRSFIMDMDKIEDEEEKEDSGFMGSHENSSDKTKQDIPSREDLLKEIEEIGEGQNVPPPAPAIPVAYSPIETSLANPVVTTPVDLDKELKTVTTPLVTPATPVETKTEVPPAVPKANDPYRELP